MREKGKLVLLIILAVVLSVPVSADTAQSYGRVWTAYPDQAPIWNIYQGGSPIEWLSWANNPRFSIFTAVWYGNQNNVDLVLDSATGLVWQRRPLNSTGTWAEAQFGCVSLMTGTGYLMGWRLPQVEELTSLIDYSYGGTILPAGHPFMIGNDYNGFAFWSATTDPRSPSKALFVDFSNRSQPVGSISKSSPMNAWCVRGGTSPPTPGAGSI
ncbi:MAG TPA: DUF1566 domain-containing protein [Syntrophales bacterium]|nr:DUF1566 domain-containing protein [Syntrophales bacterium]